MTEGEAEDVLQEVYVTVWRKAAAFDPGRASPITWMVAIARNRAIDRLRASAVSRRMEPIEAADAVSDPSRPRWNGSSWRSSTNVSPAAWKSWRPATPAAIRAAFSTALLMKELATRMSVPLGTMKSWIRRGLLS